MLIHPSIRGDCSLSRDASSSLHPAPSEGTHDILRPKRHSPSSPSCRSSISWCGWINIGTIYLWIVLLYNPLVNLYHRNYTWIWIWDSMTFYNLKKKDKSDFFCCAQKPGRPEEVSSSSAKVRRDDAWPAHAGPSDSAAHGLRDHVRPAPSAREQLHTQVQPRSHH